MQDKKINVGFVNVEISWTVLDTFFPVILTTDRQTGKNGIMSIENPSKTKPFSCFVTVFMKIITTPRPKI